MSTCRRALRQPRGEGGEGQRRAVGDHMPGIAEQCQRSRPEAGQRLDDGKGERQQQGPDQSWTGISVVMMRLRSMLVAGMLALVMIMMMVAHDGYFNRHQ
jgi:hypothetical protein